MKDDFIHCLEALSYVLSDGMYEDQGGYFYKRWNKFHDLERGDSNGLPPLEPKSDRIYQSLRPAREKGLVKDLRHCLQGLVAYNPGLGLKVQLATEAWLKHEGMRALWEDE